MKILFNSPHLLICGLLLASSTSAYANEDAFTKILEAAKSPKEAKVKPLLLSHEDDNKYAAALKYEIEYETGLVSLEDCRPGLDLYSNFKSEGTIATDSDLNTENLYAEAKLGFRYQSGQNEAPNESVYMTRPDQPSPVPSGNQQDFRPFFHLSSLVRYETDQSFDNQNLAYGASFHSINTSTDKLPEALYPYWSVSFTRVEVLQSKDFEDRGIDEDSFWRLQTELEWNFQLGEYMKDQLPSWAEGIGFIPRIVYSRAYELSDGASRAGFDDDFFFSGTIYAKLESMNIKSDSWPVQLDQVFFRVSTGAIAPETDDSLQFQIGVVINFNP